MTNYTFGFYRVVSPFDEERMRRVLDALDGLEMGFLPATLAKSRTDSVVLKGSADYARTLLPNEFFIDADTATIPLNAKNEVKIAFTESGEPRLVPASLVLQMTDATLASNRWSLDDLARVCLAVVETFEPDYAYMFDDLHARRPQYKARMFKFDRLMAPSGLFWINYYGPAWVRNIGWQRLERLSPVVPLWKRLKDGGVLVAIQASPYKENEPAHRAAQERLETLLGLHDVQGEFPNRGF